MHQILLRLADDGKQEEVPARGGKRPDDRKLSDTPLRRGALPSAPKGQPASSPGSSEAKTRGTQPPKTPVAIPASWRLRCWWLAGTSWASSEAAPDAKSFTLSVKCFACNISHAREIANAEIPQSRAVAGDQARGMRGSQPERAGPTPARAPAPHELCRRPSSRGGWTAHADAPGPDAGGARCGSRRKHGDKHGRQLCAAAHRSIGAAEVAFEGSGACR